MKFMQIQPQKARGFLDPDMWDSDEWAVEEKFDGDRRIAQFINGIVRFTGTRKSVDGAGFVEKTLNLPHLNSYKEDLEGTVLDGEIIVEGYTSNMGGRSKLVTSIMGSAPDEARRKQQARGWLRYAVFDCLWYKGHDLRKKKLATRREYARKALIAWGKSHTFLVEQYHGVGKYKIYAFIVSQGGEGVVLKHLEHTYGDSKLWVKVKHEATADVVILGFTPGKGKYADRIGSIEFGQHHRGALTKFGQCAGFDDDLRARLTRSPRSYIGRVIKIKHWGREPTGAFRHPQFLEFRDDKDPQDCRYYPHEQ